MDNAEKRVRVEEAPEIRFTLGVQEERKLKEEGMVLCFSQNKDIAEVDEKIYVKGEGGVYEVRVEDKTDDQTDAYHPSPSSEVGVNFQIRFLRRM